jgi:hypothetical protein
VELAAHPNSVATAAQTEEFEMIGLLISELFHTGYGKCTEIARPAEERWRSKNDEKKLGH